MFSKSLGLACLVVLLPIAALAQSPAIRVQPYTFIGPGAVNETTLLHVGGGADVVHRNGLGIGTEFGYAGPFPDGFDYGIGLLSFTGSYRWLNGSRLVPLVNSGITVVTIRGSGWTPNVGAGAEYWFSDGVGLRLELRDHIESHGEAQLWSARVVGWESGGNSLRRICDREGLDAAQFLKCVRSGLSRTFSRESGSASRSLRRRYNEPNGGDRPDEIVSSHRKAHLRRLPAVS